MDGQHQYEISLKKDELFINLSSDDVYFISKQMDKWFRILLDDSYVPVSMPTRPTTPSTQTLPPTIPDSVHAHPPMPPISERVAASVPAPTPPTYPESVPNVQPVAEATAATFSASVPTEPVAIPPAPVAPSAVETLVASAPESAAPALTPMPAPSMPQPLAETLPAENPVAAPIAPAAPVQPSPQVGAAVAPAAPTHASVHLPMTPNVPAAPPAMTLPESQPHAILQNPPQPSMAAPTPSVLTQAAGNGPGAELPNLTSFKTLPPGQDDFEAIMDSVMKDLEEEPAPAPAIQDAVYPSHSPSHQDDTVDETVQMLYQTAGSERFAPEESPYQPSYEIPNGYTASNGMNHDALPEALDLSNIVSLSDLCDRSRANRIEDFLLLASYYLMHYEHQNTFSLKRLNSILVKSGLTPVNHSVLEAALSEGRLAMVPDLTGMAEVSEYQLTAEGQHEVVRLL